MQKKELYAVPVPVLDTYALTVCALLTALSVVLARLLTIIPSEVSRFSLEAVPILLAGLLFGPLPGAAVGFAADFIGCLFSPFGYNPIFCLPPILYGLCAGLFRPWLTQKISPLRIAAAFCVTPDSLRKGWVPLYANQYVADDIAHRKSNRIPRREDPQS